MNCVESWQQQVSWRLTVDYGLSKLAAIVVEAHQGDPRNIAGMVRGLMPIVRA